MLLSTPFTRIFGCKVPIMGAPMAGPSGGALAAATCRGGALGSIAAGHANKNNGPDLERQIEIFREQAPTGAPLVLGFIGFSSLSGGKWNDRVKPIIERYSPEVVQFFAPAIVNIEDSSTSNNANANENNISLARAMGCKVIAQVGNANEAERALEAGVDCLVAQGGEAGGHGLRPGLYKGTLPLARHLVQLAEPFGIPVLAAGGIVDGRGLAAALALGCDGAVLGTRLWASQEALGHESYKNRLVLARGPDDVVRTTVGDQIMGSYSVDKWPEPYDSMGVLRNDTTDTWDGKPKELNAAMNEVAAIYSDAAKKGNPDVACVYSGQGVGSIKSIESAEVIVERVNEEAVQVIQGIQKLLS